MSPNAKNPQSNMAHIPVMLEEMLSAMSPNDGEAYVDGTFGGGGYASALLKSAKCRVWGLDQDPDAVVRGAVLAKKFPGRLTVIQGKLSEMETRLSALGVNRVDGVALDIGVSAFQLNEVSRGFSFQRDGLLDMRMGVTGTTASDIINHKDEAVLRQVIHTYGEERYARRIARAIVSERIQRPIYRTRQLADIIAAAIPRTKRLAPNSIHPATRTFQALRIYVNDEIVELKRGLAAAERLLKPHGRLVVVSFHSLEDREVKRFLRLRSGNPPRTSRHLPFAEKDLLQPTFQLIFRGIERPSEVEIKNNPSARSAKLRAAIRTEAPARSEGAVP